MEHVEVVGTSFIRLSLVSMEQQSVRSKCNSGRQKPGPDPGSGGGGGGHQPRLAWMQY